MNVGRSTRLGGSRYRAREIPRALRWPRALFALAALLGTLSAGREAPAAGIVQSAGEDHFTIFMWIANEAGGAEAERRAQEHCAKYNKRAKFKDLTKNVYSYECVAAESAQAPAPLDIGKIKAVLALISDHVDRICKTVPLEGGGSRATFEANAKVEANSLLKKVADAGLALSGDVSEDSFTNVLRKDLPTVLASNAKCRQEESERLENYMLPRLVSAN